MPSDNISNESHQLITLSLRSNIQTLIFLPPNLPPHHSASLLQEIQAPSFFVYALPSLFSHIATFLPAPISIQHAPDGAIWIELHSPTLALPTEAKEVRVSI